MATVNSATLAPLIDLVERVTAAARVGNANELDLLTLRLLVVDRHGLPTIEQATRVGQIERTLDVSMSPGQRRDIICERLGLSRRRFYELKKLASAAPDRTPSR